jgi:hypothetical protein
MLAAIVLRILSKTPDHHAPIWYVLSRAWPGGSWGGLHETMRVHHLSRLRCGYCDRPVAGGRPNVPYLFLSRWLRICRCFSCWRSICVFAPRRKGHDAFTTPVAVWNALCERRRHTKDYEVGHYSHAREAIDRMYRCVIARIAVPPTLLGIADEVTG